MGFVPKEGWVAATQIKLKPSCLVKVLIERQTKGFFVENDVYFQCSISISKVLL